MNYEFEVLCFMIFGTGCGKLWHKEGFELLVTIKLFGWVIRIIQNLYLEETVFVWMENILTDYTNVEKRCHVSPDYSKFAVK